MNSEAKKMIIAKNCYYDMDCIKTRLNNNVLVVGASGTGKTRSIVSPNILQATGSYIVSDPKGNLYGKYKDYLEEHGYKVICIDFKNPEKSCKYNPLAYMKTSQDIMAISHIIIGKDERDNDPIWRDMAQIQMEACLGLLLEVAPEKDRTLENFIDLMDGTQVNGEPERTKSETDIVFDKLRKLEPNCYAVKQYDKFRIAGEKTYRSIQAVSNSRTSQISTPEILSMTSANDIDFKEIGQRKTAVFVVCSDMDRSVDFLVNLFFTQAMTQLCKYADEECEDSALPVPVRFIMDDFATNCTIADFPRMISSIRSRNISTMIMIQAESQLMEAFEEDGKTIISNCDTYVYLGGNDIETAKNVAERADVNLKKILYMPVGTNWIFRRGQEPVNGLNFDLENYFQEEIEHYKPVMDKKEEVRIIGFAI